MRRMNSITKLVKEFSYQNESRRQKMPMMTKVALVCLGGIIFLTVPVGGIDAAEVSKEKIFHFHTDEGLDVSEKISVQDNEEIITLDDGTRLCLDYSRGYLVMQRSGDGGTCYVTTFDTDKQLVPSVQELSRMETELNVTVDEETYYIVDRSHRVDRNLLSKHSRMICAKNRIFWMTKMERNENEMGRSKRAWNCRYYCYPTCTCCPVRCDGVKCGVSCTF